jgi:formylglycine-generating enzyme required for sulfatase activity
MPLSRISSLWRKHVGVPLRASPIQPMGTPVRECRDVEPASEVTGSRAAALVVARSSKMQPMGASWSRLLVAAVLVAVLVAVMGRPAAGDSCSEAERDEQGRCPPKLEVRRRSPAPAAKKLLCPAGMVRVPAGKFQMGSSDGVGNAEERPQHEVTLAGYCIDKREVTVKQYDACAAAKGCPAASRTVRLADGTAEDVLKQRSLLCNGDDRPDHPINCVDWTQAVAYCRWAGKRLPTEAEWEYAARGADGRGYPWGNEPPSARRLNACGTECVAMWARVFNARSEQKMYEASDGWETTAPVGSFPAGASPFGVLDMAGNVEEWTADWHAAYSREAATNPRGVQIGSIRVLRGSGWGGDVADESRAAFRSSNEPNYRLSWVGFRCARGD